MNYEQNDNPKMQPQPPPYSAGPPPTVVGGVQHGVVHGMHPGVIHGVQPGVYHAVQPGTTVIHTNMGMMPMVVASSMGPMPASMQCKSCGHEIVTRVDIKPSLKTHLFAALLCLIGCWPFACVPYCVNSCHNADHYCPNCNAYIGSYLS